MYSLVLASYSSEEYSVPWRILSPDTVFNKLVPEEYLLPDCLQNKQTCPYCCFWKHKGLENCTLPGHPVYHLHWPLCVESLGMRSHVYEGSFHYSHMGTFTHQISCDFCSDIFSLGFGPFRYVLYVAVSLIPRPFCVAWEWGLQPWDDERDLNLIPPSGGPIKLQVAMYAGSYFMQ